MSADVLVLGGTGFIGRHAVAALEATAASVTVGTRAPSSGQVLPQREIKFEAMTRPQDWSYMVGEFDVVLNCVGILRPQRSASYDQVHHLAPAALASACAGSDTRFVHVSALALHPGDRSGFLRSKLEGEHAIQQTGADWIIARPSLLDGEGGYGARWLRGVSRLPIFACPMDAKGNIAALMVTDLGQALARLCLGSAEELRLSESREFELGGVQCYDFEHYIRGLRRRYTQTRAFAVPIPGIAARLGAHICDLFHLTPFSFGHWELLRKDNVPQPNRLPELLGRTPAEVIPAKEPV